MLAIVLAGAEKLHCDPAIIGEQHHVIEGADLAIELFHAGPGHLDEAIDLVLVLAQGLVGDVAGRTGPGGIETIAVDAAAPGAFDDRLSSGRAVQGVQDRLDMLASCLGDAHGHDLAPSTRRWGMGCLSNHRTPPSPLA